VSERYDTDDPRDSADTVPTDSADRSPSQQAAQHENTGEWTHDAGADHTTAANADHEETGEARRRIEPREATPEESPTAERVQAVASQVSHDLKSQLTVARGRLDMARQEVNNNDLAKVATALDRMDRIIEDLLWLARGGRNIGATEPTSLHDAVDAAWDVVAHAADGADLRHDDDQSLPTIEADDDRLQQLLENLLSNAIEHGGPDVTVTVGRLDDGFYFEGDVSGISPDDREERFTAGYTTFRGEQVQARVSSKESRTHTGGTST